MNYGRIYPLLKYRGWWALWEAKDQPCFPPPISTSHPPGLYYKISQKTIASLSPNTMTIFDKKCVFRPKLPPLLVTSYYITLQFGRVFNMARMFGRVKFKVLHIQTFTRFLSPPKKYANEMSISTDVHYSKSQK